MRFYKIFTNKLQHMKSCVKKKEKNVNTELKSDCINSATAVTMTWFQNIVFGFKSTGLHVDLLNRNSHRNLCDPLKNRSLYELCHKQHTFYQLGNMTLSPNCRRRFMNGYMGEWINFNNNDDDDEDNNKRERDLMGSENLVYFRPFIECVG